MIIKSILTRRLLVWGIPIVIIAVSAIAGYANHRGYQRGYSAAMAEVAEQIAEQEKEAAQAVARLRQAHERNINKLRQIPDSGLPVGPLTNEYFERLREQQGSDRK